MPKKKSETYKVKRYVVKGPEPGLFKTVSSSTDKAKAERSFYGWGKQLPGGDFILETPSGRTIKERFAGVFSKKSEQLAYKREHAHRQRQAKRRRRR